MVIELVKSDPTIVAPFSGEFESTVVPQNGGFLPGFFLDPSNGPVQSGRRAIARFEPTPNQIQAIHITTVEDDTFQNLRDAQYFHAGWPAPNLLPKCPWSILNTEHSTESGRWASRRMLFQMWTISVQARELRPTDDFANAVQSALDLPTDAARIQSLREVFATWGDMIPLISIIGGCISATGVLPVDVELGSSSSCCRPAELPPVRDLNSVIDTELGTRGKFERRLKSQIQGGIPDLYLREGLDTWTSSVDASSQWEIIKVLKAAPITDILDCTVQRRIKQLFANPGIIYRSPLVGVSRHFGFDGDSNELCAIEQLEIGCSDSRVERITVRYAGGLVVGPHGTSMDPTRSDKIKLSPGDFITDIFVWATDQLISSIQFVKNTGYVSPMYGLKAGVTQPPQLLSGNGNALAGLSGSFDADGISQVQAIWRGDILAEPYRRTQTSFAGGWDGVIWNDLKFLGDQSTARISEITSRSPGTGFIGGLQVTYSSLAGGYLARQETPIRGTEGGDRTTWTLEDGEYIVGVRGRHDGTSICELQFTTNRPNNESPAFGHADGSYSFSYSAPRTRDGKDMQLLYTCGKSAARVNSLLFVWADPTPSPPTRLVIDKAPQATGGGIVLIG